LSAICQVNLGEPICPNSTSHGTRMSLSMTTFRSHLKTEVFQRSYA